MNCKKAPPRADMFPASNRAWQLACSNHGNVVRTKKAKHIPKTKFPKRGYPLIWISSPAHWRRAWLGQFAKRWKWIFDDGDRAWWNTQAASIAFTNEKNVTVTRTGFQLYMWYQWRKLTMKMNRYIPFPIWATDFAFTFTPPWEPPELEAPTIVSASAPGTVRIRCLNKTPVGLPLLPLAWWKIPPTIKPIWTPGHHPWYWFDSTVDGNHTEYSYYLETLFPKIKPGTQATFVHCYGTSGPDPTLLHSHGTFATAGTVSRSAQPWTTPGNILDDNASVASATKEGDFISWQTDWIKAQAVTWTPAIPDDAVIAGFIIEFMADSKGNDHAMRLQHIHLLKAGTPTASYDTGALVPYNQAYPWAYIPIGSNSNKWGTTWTGADLNDALFGIYLYMQGYNDLDDGIVEIAHVRITAYYRIDPGWFTIPSQLPFTFT